jgi:hypothetical protein
VRSLFYLAVVIGRPSAHAAGLLAFLLTFFLGLLVMVVSRR